MKRRPGDEAPPSLPPEESEIFRGAVKDVRPLPPVERAALPAPRPRPVPAQRLKDEREALVDSLSDHVPWTEDVETGDELSFLRPGLPRHTLRKLRRGHWVTQAELDLHGFTSEEARVQIAEFLHLCQVKGWRCVRIIHGKGLGSKNREPVLKHKVKAWLMQRDEILAFCQARPVDGGGGAAMVLLKSKTRP